MSASNPQDRAAAVAHRDTGPLNSPRSTPAPRLRWWIPITVAVLATANVVRLQRLPETDGMFKNMQTFMTIGASLLLVFVWWLFLTGLPWRKRLTGLAVVALVLGALKVTARVDGSTGAGRPNVVWRWTPKKTGNVGQLEPSAGVDPATSATARPAASLTGDYPGYLGPERSGTITGLHLDPDWSAHPPKELWRRPIGLGWSAFAVSGSRAITQEQRGADEMIVCYDLSTGLPAWSHANQVRFSEPMGGDGPRATPTIHGDRVYALGATGILDCLETSTGRLIWTHDTLKENGLPNTPFGKSSSPLLIDDLVVVTGGLAKKSTLLAYHSGDGSPAWQVGTDESSFSSPTLATLAGHRQIVSINAASVTGHDPADGHVLWEYSWANNKWPKCAQPILLDGDRILLSASFDAGCVLLQIKAEPDGKLSATELWKNRSMKSDFSNLVTKDGFLYGLDDGILACVEIATGQRKWKSGRYGHGQLLLMDDWLMIQTEQGPVVLVEANPAAYREVSRLNALPAKTWNTPALAGNLLFVRNDQEAACYQLPTRPLPVNP